MTNYIFKIASCHDEYEQIHTLNHEVFAKEIAQHGIRHDARLIDQFDHENTYIICKSGTEVLGMLAIRDVRPFSVDLKLAGLNLKTLEEYVPALKRMCEIRLLSIKDCYRKTRILTGLLCKGYETLEQHGYDLFLINGILEQHSLYLRLGFNKFGPLIGKGRASFQPMYMTYAQSLVRLKPFLLKKISVLRDSPSNYLPGPVAISSETLTVLAQAPISHRSQVFKRLFNKLERQLCDLVASEQVLMFAGGGTLANDFMLGLLGQHFEKGVILSNGEFGERLVRQARHQQLTFTEYSQAWGLGFNLDLLDELLKQGRPDWLLLAHCETSTGFLNDLPEIQKIAQRYNTRVCVDCVSSIGVVELDLRNIYLATASSGKGLASIPGLGLLFFNKLSALAGQKSASPTSPCSTLDIQSYINHQGIPHTISSNLVAALEQSLKSRHWVKQILWTRKISSWLRQSLGDMGYKILVGAQDANLAVITIELPAEVDSLEFGNRLREAGIYISYESGYLIQRNYIQICFMGDAVWGSHLSILTMFKILSESLTNKASERSNVVRFPGNHLRRNRRHIV